MFESLLNAFRAPDIRRRILSVPGVAEVALFGGDVLHDFSIALLFGVIVGAINGYLISGTILFYLVQSRYQAFPNVVLPPAPETEAAVQRLMAYMPPNLFGEPGIYFAVILCFIFVIIVYI